MEEEILKEIQEFKSNDVKIVAPHYSHVDNVLGLTLLYSNNYNHIDLKEKFISLVSKYLEDEINYDIILQKSLTDNEVIDEVKRILSKYTTGNVLLFKNVHLLEDENGKTIVCTSIRDVNDQDLLQIRKEINEFLSKNCITNYKLHFVLEKDEEFKQNSEETLIDREQEILADLPQIVEIKDPTYQVEISHIIYGNKITNIATKICVLNQEVQGVLIAGKISNFTENYYNKKDNPEEQKIRYNFTLTDSTGSIKAVFFPPKKFLEQLGEQSFNLVEEQEVIVYCDVSLYKETLSIKVREIAECVLPQWQEETKEEEQEMEKQEKQPIEFITTVNENYNLVFPKPYNELAQLDIFSLVSQPPKNMIGKDFVVFDLETTGFDPTNCDIIEIGAVKVRDGKIIESFTTLLKPRASIPQEITELTGISDDMVVFAPSFYEVVADFYKFTRGATMVAHNANFDMPFLRYHAENLRYNFDNEVKDTLAMARAMVKGVKNYKLKTLTEHFNIVLNNAHRALNDTVATAKVFIELCKLESNEK